jgi:WD40 repeat protein
MGCYHEPVRFYRVPSGERLRLAGPTHVGDLMDLWFSPDGEVLYSTGDDELTVDWDAETLRPLAVRPTKPRYAREVALEPPRRDLNDPFPLGDGANLNFLYPINGDSFVLPVSVTDAASGETTRQRGIPLPWFMKSHEQGVVPGGKYFYLETQIYDLETLELVAGRRLPGWDIYSVAFSADGSRYAIGAADGRREDATRSLRVLETLSSKTLWYAEWKSGGIQHVVFSPDGKKLAWFDLTSIQVQQLP